MSEPLPAIYLARHGETAWSLSGRHTGRTDLPLTANGERQAAARLRAPARCHVRAGARESAAAGDAHVRACGLRRPGARRRRPRRWNYGAYEGLRTGDIRAARPGWNLFRDGCPDGETAVDVGARADRVLARARAAMGNVLLFSSGHILRVLAARWLGLAPEGGTIPDARHREHLDPGLRTRSFGARHRALERTRSYRRMINVGKVSGRISAVPPAPEPSGIAA